MSSEKTTSIVILVIWTLAISYSVIKHGYQAWFNDAEFLKANQANKKRIPPFLKRFFRDSPDAGDLWIVRIITIMGVFSVIFLLILIGLMITNGNH